MATEPNAAPAPTDGSTPNTGEAQPFDSSKLSDEDFAKLFDDQRLYKHERFKQLNERANLAKKYEADDAKRREEEAKKKGEWESLAKQYQEETNGWKTKFESSLINAAIMTEASKRGVKDLDAAAKLIDRSNVKLENDQVVGVTEAMDQLVKDRSYLLTINRNTVGNPTNPNDPQPSQKFTMTQIADPVFYAKHSAEIRLAMMRGEIVEDRR